MSLGPKFSEAARQLWLVVEGGQSVSDVARASKSNNVTRWLYGDQTPSREKALVLEGLYPKVKMRLWSVPPVEVFTPPALRDEARLMAEMTPVARTGTDSG